MTSQQTNHDWDPRAPEVLADQVAAYDDLRRRCPVAHSEYLHWSVFRHADALRVLRDPGTFINAVSTHLNVPNGMDPPQHGAYRKLTRLEPGDRLSIMWASANRDEAVFGDPDEIRPGRDASLNPLYGAGIHVCPGAPLARMQLRIVMEELLAQVRSIERVPGRVPVRARYPTGGFSSLPLRIARA